MTPPLEKAAGRATWSARDGKPSSSGFAAGASTDAPLKEKNSPLPPESSSPTRKSSHLPSKPPVRPALSNRAGFSRGVGTLRGGWYDERIIIRVRWGRPESRSRGRMMTLGWGLGKRRRSVAGAVGSEKVVRTRRSGRGGRGRTPSAYTTKGAWECTRGSTSWGGARAD